MRVGWVAMAALCAVTIAGPLSLAAQQPVDELLARLDRYLTEYEPRLSELIANEVLVQEINSTMSRLSSGEIGPGVTSRRRLLASEVAFVALPNDAGWLGFRNVQRVNNRRIRDREQSLGGALQAPSYDAARALLKASAAQNLGLPRTTNLPNLPLEFLHQRNRKRLVARLDATERIRGVETTCVVMIERVTPSLIQNPKGGDMPSVVRAWVDRHGRLLRAEVQSFLSSAEGEPESTIRVEFSAHEGLGMLVPSQMREAFPVEKPGKGSSVATYSNFRRFQTSGRIVPPPP